MGLAPNNSRARRSRARTSSSCCCSAESAMAPRYPGPGIRTIHRPQNAAPRCRYACRVAIFGRMAARQRLRRAAQESLAIPTFSPRIDCTPWVIGGLWPAELSVATGETATLAEYLKVDLHRISNSANDELKMIRRAGLAGAARQAAEARVINEARARAEQRVRSTVRQLRAEVTAAPREHSESPRRQIAEDCAEREDEKTQVIPAVTAVQPAAQPPADNAPAQHRQDAEPEPSPAQPAEPAYQQATESSSDRLRRLLAFVARQEPRLNWAVGDRDDGTTVVVTDFAHGWIPPGIALPAGVRLLEPDRRDGKASALLGNTTCAATYSPGDSFGWSADVAATESSMQPHELPPVDDLGWELGAVTHWRDGLPRMVHTLAKAAAAGTGIAAEEVDLLRVYLDTARYRLLDQYPAVDPALLLNCMLLAATEGIVTGDSISANYHLTWFQKLNAPPASRWVASP
jgi:Family of unknown function (DUF5631)/Family of unknown function (DUF5632)